MQRAGSVTAAASLVRLLPATPAAAALSVDEDLVPFVHGVASFEPLPDAVLLWTRVQPPVGHDGSPIAVTWTAATDLGLTQHVRTGQALAHAGADWTVTVDLVGLAPATHHFFRFDALGATSLVGRTRTAPAPGVGDDHMRIGVVSCSNYEAGYFNAYARLAERDDIDVVLHVGDYVYEYANGAYTGARDTVEPRLHEPATEMVTLADYRLRYASYRTDPDLRRLHQLFPMVHTWDDHESTNNSYRDGAQNHTEATEGPWEVRKQAMARACQEWLPKRLLDVEDPLRIYRSFRYGSLADVIVMDTRIEGRDREVSALLTSPSADDPDREMISGTQRQWLFEELSASAAAGSSWRIIAQQVMMMQFNAGGLPRLDLLAGMGGQDSPSLVRQGGNAFNGDAWDGYTAERDRLYDHVLGSDIQDVVVLTGDIHTSWAADLTRDPYNPTVYDPTGLNPAVRNVGVEFVTPSVTSPNFDAVALAFPERSPADPAFLAAVNALEVAILADNPHIRMAELTSHGYNVLDVTPQRVQSDWYFVEAVDRPAAGESWFRGWTVDRGEHVLRPAPAEAGDRPTVVATPAATPARTPHASRR